MREILFKAKRIDNGEWVEGYYFEFIDKSYITDMERSFMEAFYTQKSVVDFHMRAYEVEADTVCRYTGLRDYNFDKIWENDVIKEYCNGLVGRLIWDVPTATYKLEGFGNDYKFEDAHIEWEVIVEWEVIGNIFDNPELLERK